MSQCPRCGKRVFFAERKQSLGKDWHRQCLTCESCTKVLNPGQHAEHKGVPYCEVPCYKALFGPKLYGFGSQVESHDYSPKSERKAKHPQSSSESLSTNHSEAANVSMSSPRIDGRAPKVTQQQLSELEDKLKIHNDVHPQNFISLIEKDSHVTLEGLLRVHWGVQTNIQFKKDDSHEATPFTARLHPRNRINKTRSFHSDLYADNIPEKMPVKDPFKTLKSSGVPPEISAQQLLAVKMKRGQFHTIRESKLRRRFSINGHYYKKELEPIGEDESMKPPTSHDFTPAFGSVTQVFVGSHLRTPEVIKRLLDKFKIENNSSRFALYMVKPNGEMWPLTDAVFPLLERVNLLDPAARIFLMDRPHQAPVAPTIDEAPVDDRSLVSATISDVWRPVEAEPEVSHDTIPRELTGFLCLPEPMLLGFIAMFNNEHQVAQEKLKEKYEKLRSHIKRLMSEKQMTEETYL